MPRPPQKPIRLLVIITLTLIVLYVGPIALESRRPFTSQSGSSGEDEDEHLIERYISSFPKLRGKEARGIPEDVVGLMERDGKHFFDWPRAEHMFVL